MLSFFKFPNSAETNTGVVAFLLPCVIFLLSLRPGKKLTTGTGG